MLLTEKSKLIRNWLRKFPVNQRFSFQIDYPVPKSYRRFQLLDCSVAYFFSYIIPEASYSCPKEARGAQRKRKEQSLQRMFPFCIPCHLQQKCGLVLVFFPYLAFLPEQDLSYINLLLLPILCISTELELRFGWELTCCFLPAERLDTMCQLVDCAMTTIR